MTIVNETLARRFFGDLDPVGRTVAVFGSHAETVVGVVKDVKYAGLDAASEVTLYQPFAQNPFAYMSVAVRTSGDSLTLAPAIRDQVANLDRQAALGRVRMMDELLAESVGAPRFRTLLLLAFVGVALLLEAVGIYGVLAPHHGGTPRVLDSCASCDERRAGVHRLRRDKTATRQLRPREWRVSFEVGQHGVLRGGQPLRSQALIHRRAQRMLGTLQLVPDKVQHTVCCAHFTLALLSVY